MMNENGEIFIQKIVSELLKEYTTFEKAIPELEIKFDKYGRGRFHDLGIWGTTNSKKKVFVGIEAKVDESFNKKVAEVYIRKKIEELNGKSTKAPKRIEELLKRNFKVIKPEHFDLRYQFLYSTVGTIEANADISILCVIVFQTDGYNEIKGKRNYMDHIQFIDSIDSEPIDSNPEIDVHKLKIGDKSMYSIYVKKR